MKRDILRFTLTCLSLLAATSTLVGCVSGEVTRSQNHGDERAAALCEDADEHIQSCFADAQPPTECDADAAREVLGQSCEELESQSTNPKADQICNPYLWWTWGACSGDAEQNWESRSFWVSVRMCNDDICDGVYGGATCALVTLEDASGEEVARAYTNNNSNARFEDVELPAGDYTLRLHHRGADEELAQVMTSQEGSIALSGRAEAALPLTVVDGEEIERPHFYVSREEVSQIKGCSRVRGTVSSTCQGQPMEAAATEWSWLVRVQGENNAGDFVELTRPLNFQGVNQFNFLRLMPGIYELSFLEVEIPEWSQRPNPDYAELADRYATGRAINRELIVTTDQIPGDVDLEEPFELDHQACQVR